MVHNAWLFLSLPVLVLIDAPVARAGITPPGTQVTVEILEDVTDQKKWDLSGGKPTGTYTEPAFGLTDIPQKFNRKGLVVDRSNPFVLRAEGTVALPAGEYRLLLRSHGAARLYVDGRLIVQTEFLQPNASGHEHVPDLPASPEPDLCSLPVGHQEKIATLSLAEGPHQFQLEAFVGGKRLRPELGELLVGIASPGEPFRLLGSKPPILLSEEGWAAYKRASRERHERRDAVARKAARAEEDRYWARRHELARKLYPPGPAVPEVSATAPVHNAIDHFIGQRLEEKGIKPAPLVDDWSFLRRVTLDTVGVIPSREEIEAFRNDQRPDRRARAIDRLLDDPRWADHWVGYWQDVLAENPGILKPTLNNTGPFRWWIHQSFLDNTAADRFVTELVLMEGSKMDGGPAGFGLATQNDAPMAAKAHVLAKAFLGIELQCARCHDAPYHPFLQKDLFSLAAMLRKGPQTVPLTSTVRVPEGGRQPLVDITLEPGAKVEPAWPFEDLAPAALPPGILRERNNPRERLAAILTSPHNERFAEVMVNRLWKRYLGWGLVEPVDDWTGAEPSHPELLKYLARELAAHDYDLKHVARLILNSHTYQRAVLPATADAPTREERLFAGPARRRMTAEQLLDSLFLAAGKEFHCEPLTMDPEGRRPVTEMINLGIPRRAWEFTSLSNERDRPALALPVAQSMVDLLAAYGWRDSRPNPLTVREEATTPLQPLILANGVAGSRVTTLSDDSAFTALCLEDRPLPDLVRAVFLQVLSRPPSAKEQQLFEGLLRDGYDQRRVPGAPLVQKRKPLPTSAVSWANHLSPEATRIKLELERAARAGDPPTERLRADWRERMEDMVWSLVNSPEYVFVP